MSIYEKIEKAYLSFIPSNWLGLTPVEDRDFAKMNFALNEVANISNEVDSKVRQFFAEHRTLEGLGKWAEK